MKRKYSKRKKGGTRHKEKYEMEKNDYMRYMDDDYDPDSMNYAYYLDVFANGGARKMKGGLGYYRRPTVRDYIIKNYGAGKGDMSGWDNTHKCPTHVDGKKLLIRDRRKIKELRKLMKHFFNCRKSDSHFDKEECMKCPMCRKYIKAMEGGGLMFANGPSNKSYEMVSVNGMEPLQKSMARSMRRKKPAKKHKESHQCEAMTKAHIRCKNKCKRKYCHVHKGYKGGKKKMGGGKHKKPHNDVKIMKRRIIQHDYHLSSSSSSSEEEDFDITTVAKKVHKGGRNCKGQRNYVDGCNLCCVGLYKNEYKKCINGCMSYPPKKSY